MKILMVLLMTFSCSVMAGKQGVLKVFEYTIMTDTLPDGKHPVYVYYFAGKNIVRVEMPSLDMCSVTNTSKVDLDILKSPFIRMVGKRDLGFAQEIWNAAFGKYLISGTPNICK